MLFCRWANSRAGCWPPIKTDSSPRKPARKSKVLPLRTLFFGVPAKMNRCREGMSCNLGLQRVAPDGRATDRPRIHQGCAGTGPEERLPSAAERLMHSGGGHRRRRAGHGDAGGRVDDGDGITSAGGRGLVEFQRVLALEAGRDECGRGRVERESGRNRLGLLRGRRLGGVARQRRALRGAGDGDQLFGGPVRCTAAEGGMWLRQAAATHVDVRQQVGAELEVVFELKRTAGLELHAESGQRGRLVEVLHAAGAAELAVGVLGDGEPRGAAVAAAAVVVVVRHRGRMRRLRIVVVV